MTFVHEENFEINQSTFKILKVQSRFETTLTLYLQVSVLGQPELLWIPIFIIEEEDIFWNSLTANQIDKNQNISLIPCFDFLRNYAVHFENYLPGDLTSKSKKEANKFSNRICKTYLALDN